MSTVIKRKRDSVDPNPGKRIRLMANSSSNLSPASSSKQKMTTNEEPIGAPNEDTNESSTELQIPQGDSSRVKRRKINKLVPPRPFPTVPTSVSATGPRSAHHEGKNFICLTRKTSIAAYMRRCKDVILQDGYKTLHLSAMGAAIPHLLQLIMALPSTLPFPTSEIHTEVTTGTVHVQDEVIPDDEDEDFTYESRGKSTLQVVFKIGDGTFDGEKRGASKKTRKRWEKSVTDRKHGVRSMEKAKAKASSGGSDVIIQEPEQQEMEML